MGVPRCYVGLFADQAIAYYTPSACNAIVDVPLARQNLNGSIAMVGNADVVRK